MANPFTTFRAAEHADTMEGFLSLVVPDPLEQYFEEYFDDGLLFRRAMFVYGQPGSGKTTLARLFEPAALSTLLRNDSGHAFTAVRAAIARSGAIEGDLSSIVGARVPLESDFRDLASLPYSPEIRRQLLLRLIQARAVLRWFAQLQHIGIACDDVTIVAREGFEANLEMLGGEKGGRFLARARSVENAIYSIIGALVPPSESRFSDDLQLPYHPFDIITEIKIDSETARNHKLRTRLRPFVMLDDAHSLNPEQFQVLRQWVTRREISIGRWILSRLDALNPSEIAGEFIEKSGDDASPGIRQQRDFDIIALQGIGGDRAAARRKFRQVAMAISQRYLRQVDAFSRAHIADLASILDTTVEPIPNKRLSLWKDEIDIEINRKGFSKVVRDALKENVDSILKQRNEHADDLRVALTRILVHRRSMARQLNLFELDEGEAPFRATDASLLGGAEIHLFRAFNRSYYYGFEQLSLASSENPELFVSLASSLVEASLNLLSRRQKPSLNSSEQHRLLREKSSEMLMRWNFPEVSTVRRLVEGIARRCERATDAPNAYLKSGANAFGIPMSDFDAITKANAQLANTIKYGVAYSVFSIALSRSVKNQQWCLITLGGIACLHYGLTLALGGFVEGTAKELNNMILDE